jgi:hypothetical protein
MTVETRALFAKLREELTALRPERRSQALAILRQLEDAVDAEVAKAKDHYL